MRKYGFNQSNSNHTLFLKRNGGKTVALIINVNNMIVIGNDEKIIAELQKYLSSEFKMKDPGGLLQKYLASKFKIKDLRDLKYFLGIGALRGVYVFHKENTPLTFSNTMSF